MSDGFYDQASTVAVRFNTREIIVPLCQLGVAPYEDGVLVRIWEQFKDWRR